MSSQLASNLKLQSLKLDMSFSVPSSCSALQKIVSINRRPNELGATALEVSPHSFRISLLEELRVLRSLEAS